MQPSVMTIQSVSDTYGATHEIDQVVAISGPHSCYKSMIMTPHSPSNLSPHHAHDHDPLQPAHRPSLQRPPRAGRMTWDRSKHKGGAQTDLSFFLTNGYGGNQLVSSYIGPQGMLETSRAAGRVATAQPRSIPHRSSRMRVPRRD